MTMLEYASDAAMFRTHADHHSTRNCSTISGRNYECVNSYFLFVLISRLPIVATPHADGHRKNGNGYFVRTKDMRAKYSMTVLRILQMEC
jgi:hypothetical protein